MPNDILGTVYSQVGPLPPLVEVSSDPNFCVLLWLWGKGPNPYIPRPTTKTYRCAAPFASRLIRVNGPITVLDSTRP